MIILRNCHVLVVDDSAAIRSIIRKLLAQLGFDNVDEASDGAVALAKISEKKLWLGDFRLEHAPDGWAGVAKAGAREQKK